MYILRGDYCQAGSVRSNGLASTKASTAQILLSNFPNSVRVG